MPVISIFFFKIYFDDLFELHETFSWLKAPFYNSKSHTKLAFSLLEGVEMLTVK